MQRINFFLFLFLFVIFIIPKRAISQTTSSLSISKNARTFEMQHTTLSMKALAHSCLTITRVPDGLPCNPAMVPFNKKSNLSAESLLSNGLANYERVRNILNGNIDQNAIDGLFGENKSIQIESNIDINFITPYLNAQYTPIAVRAFSIMRNEAHPEVDFYAIEESSYTFQSGFEAFQNFYIGLQVRQVERSFVKQKVQLLSLATEEGKNSLKPNKQSATYIEPGATWFINNSWKPRLSFFVANSGVLSKKYDNLISPIDPQLGFGLAPPLDWGQLELSLEWRSLTYQEVNYEKLRLGAYYQFGSMNLMGGLDSSGISGGVFYDIDKLNAGVLYSSTKLVGSSDKNYTQTVYIQLGWKI